MDKALLRVGRHQPRGLDVMRERGCCTDDLKDGIQGSRKHKCCITASSSTYIYPGTDYLVWAPILSSINSKAHTLPVHSQSDRAFERQI